MNQCYSQEKNTLLLSPQKTKSQLMKNQEDCFLCTLMVPLTKYHLLTLLIDYNV